VTDLSGEPDDATPLDPDERGGLLQSWITHRRDLNEAEEQNIAEGAVWARSTLARKGLDFLSEDFVKSLHKRMFGEVWNWAGAYRHTGKRVGVDANQLPIVVPMLLDDVRHWVQQETYPPDEIAIRLHHRLAAIHPFPNGNGRHARLMADLLIERLGGQAFSWGSSNLVDVSELRAKYIAAMKAADRHDLGPLLAFARS
jgi:Fic-DOC domain mobile mystery protein B